VKGLVVRFGPMVLFLHFLFSSIRLDFGCFWRWPLLQQDSSHHHYPNECCSRCFQ
jgi:hypothetical protein